MVYGVVHGVVYGWCMGWCIGWSMGWCMRLVTGVQGLLIRVRLIPPKQAISMFKKMRYSKLHIFKVCNLISFDMYTL